MGVVFLPLGVLLMWGTPRFVVEIVGGDVRVASGLPWSRREAERFAHVAWSEILTHHDELEQILQSELMPPLPA